MSQFPITLDRYRICKGRCGQRNTAHRLVVYPDADHWTCLVCGHKETVKYEHREQDTMPYLTAEQANRIRRSLMQVVGDLQTRKWGAMGKKDRGFLSRIIDRLVGIGKDLDLE